MAEPKTTRVRWTVRALVLLLVLGGLCWSGWSAVWVVRQNEQGVVLTFGKVSRTVPPGIQLLLPWPLQTLVRVQTSVVRTMPVGFKMSDRARNMPPTPVELQWLTGDTNIVEQQAIVLYTVKDPVDYLFGVSDFPDGRPRDRVIRKATEEVISRLVAAMPIDEVLSTGKTRLQLEARKEVQEMLDSFGAGFEVTAVNIIEVAAPARVIGAFNDVSSARADMERQVSEARGYANQTRPRARAAANNTLRAAETYRNEVLNRARGAATAFLRLEQEVRRQGDLAWQRIRLDALQRMFAKVRTIVVQPSDGNARTRLVLPAKN
ncbi:MAG: FtsH protease activity modulator HflK [Planctomycetota bacterium]